MLAAVRCCCCCCCHQALREVKNFLILVVCVIKNLRAIDWRRCGVCVMNLECWMSVWVCECTVARVVGVSCVTKGVGGG